MTRRRCSEAENDIHQWHLIDEKSSTETVHGEEGAVQVTKRVDYLVRRFYCTFCRKIVEDKEEVTFE